MYWCNIPVASKFRTQVRLTIFRPDFNPFILKIIASYCKLLTCTATLLIRHCQDLSTYKRLTNHTHTHPECNHHGIFWAFSIAASVFESGVYVINVRMLWIALVTHEEAPGLNIYLPLSVLEFASATRTAKTKVANVQISLRRRDSEHINGWRWGFGRAAPGLSLNIYKYTQESTEETSTSGDRFRAPFLVFTSYKKY